MEISSNKQTKLHTRKSEHDYERETSREKQSYRGTKQYHIKVKIDNMQQNSKCRLCGEKDETINHIISRCSKLAEKEYKTWHN